MNSVTQAAVTLTPLVVILGWMVFAAAFIFRKRPPRTEELKRDKSSLIGVIIQGLGFALVWTFRRTPFTSIGTDSIAINVFLSVVTIVLVIGSIWLLTTAVQALGKQWSLAARLVEDHQLIIEGPYRIVRHPIYTGMLGMLIATGLALSRWQALVAAVIIFVFGTMFRIRIEEKLLRAEFGQSFEEYASKVPALLPMTKGV